MIIVKNKLGKIFPISIVSCNFWPKENQNLAYISINSRSIVRFLLPALPCLRLINQKEQFSYKIQA